MIVTEVRKGTNDRIETYIWIGTQVMIRTEERIGT